MEKYQEAHNEEQLNLDFFFTKLRFWASPYMFKGVDIVIYYTSSFYITQIKILLLVEKGVHFQPMILF